MNEGITVAQARRQRDELELSIRELLVDFQHETGIVPESVDLMTCRASAIGQRDEVYIAHVSVRCELG